MAAPLAAALALQAAGSIYSAYNQKTQMEDAARDEEASIPELMYRARINKQEVDQISQSLYGEQVTAVAYGGAMVDQGSPLLAYAESFGEATKQKINIQREADLQSALTSKKASSLRDQAKKVMIAGFLGAAGNTAQGIYQNQAAKGKL